jgi:zinc/manganese transport system substrate-binding protein
MRALLFTPVLLLALSGCGFVGVGAPTIDDGRIHIVASTNVYGDIAAEIGGDRVAVTSIVDDPAQDPHSVEGNARVQLALSRADIVIMNSGGYDDWMETMLDGLDHRPKVISVTGVSGYDTSGEFNEHLWYDFGSINRLGAVLQERIGELGVAWADTEFAQGLAELKAREVALAERVADAGVAITEPVPLYLLTASGFHNVTPGAFSEAIEEGTDVPPTALRDTLALFESGEATLLVYNAQTTSPETEQVKQAALAAGVPVVPVTETLPAGLHYLEWMSQNLDAIEAALP